MQQDERNRTIEDNMGLVGKVIKDKVRNAHRIGIYTSDDLFQIGCIGLCKAADTYRPGKGGLSTYAYVLIRNEIFDAIEYATLRRNREDIIDSSLLPEANAQEPFTGIQYGLELILDEAQTQAGGVTAKGIEAIRLLADGYTHREIGERMGGASANNVTAWVAKARKYLKKRPEIAVLGEFV